MDLKEINAAEPTEVASPGTKPTQEAVRRDAFAKKAFVGGVISLLLSPAYVLLGYWLNHYLAAPRLELQYATPVVIIENAKLDWDAVAALRSNSVLAANLRMNLVNIGLYRNRPTCAEWLDANQWNDDCRDDVRTALRLGSASIEAKITELDRWLVANKAGRPTPPVTWSSLEKGATPGSVAVYLEAARADKKAIDAFVKSFEGTADREGPRTGDVIIRVGVLNSGDRDGVLTRGGELLFGDSEVYMRALNYTVVKAHSFETVEYRINIDATAARDLERLRSLVRARGQDSFEMKVFGTETTLSAKGRFPE